MRTRWRWLTVALVLIVGTGAAAPDAEAGAVPRPIDFRLSFRAEPAEYTSVSCVRVGLCLAVGPQSAAVYSDGQWRALLGHGPRTMDARSVSCASDGICMATGSDHDLRYRIGRQRVSWRVADIPLAPGAQGSGNPGNGVDCVRGDWCVAVGSDITRSGVETLVISVWDGRRWTSRLAPHQPADGLGGQHVSCWALGDCLITAFAPTDFPVVVQAHVLRWSHGTVTDSRPFGAGGDTSDFPYISCTSADHCLALGSWSDTGLMHLQEQTAQWDGTSWHRRASRYQGPPGADLEAASLSCLDRNRCVAAVVSGSDKPSGIEVWAHHTWTRRSVAAPPRHEFGGLEDVTCPSARHCFAVGSYSTSRTVDGVIDAGHIG